MLRLSAQSIRYNLGLPRMIEKFNVIVFDELQSSPLTHIELLLGENILQTLVVREDLAANTVEVVLPNL